MINILEQLDVLLQVLQVKFLLGLVEKNLVRLVGFQASCLFLKIHDVLFSTLHARVQFLNLRGVVVHDALVINRSFLKSLTVVSESLGVIHNQFVAVVNFTDEEVALFLVSFLEFAQLRHNVIRVRLQVLEDFRLNLEVLVDYLHPVLNRLVLVVHFILQNLPLSFQIGQLHIDLLKDVQLAVRLKNRFFQVLHFVIRLLLILLQLVNGVFVIHKSINDRVN